MIQIKQDEELNKLNHSCAHLMAHAVKNLYKDAKFWVGPVIDDGFYYDIDLGNITITEEDLIKIEKEMKTISKSNKRIYKKIISKEEALTLFKDDPYKIDLINGFSDDEEISFYAQDDFIDLCKGPHVETTKELKHFKLTKFSGAYFKGDSNNKMLQRIYGICFKTKEDLDKYLFMLEEAKKRDHKKLGPELEIFMMSEYGPGFPFFLKNGMIIKNELETYWYQEHVKEGYEFIKTPIMLNKDLWEKSGHWANYKENMYLSEIDEKEFAIKPMNCPGGILAYKNKLYSYRDFPLRVGELGQVHRHEASGALNGLFRVRSFTQDDAHLYMTEDQIENEIVRLINFIDRIYKVFGLTYEIQLSTRPESNYIGDIKTWDLSEQALKNALEKSGHKIIINEGDGAFYGPKLDFHIKDSLGRVWQCGTIQLDMNLPERFDLTYIDNTGERKRPVMIHRVIYGSIERFIGILIEHFGGVFPLWLAPIQLNVIPVNNDAHLDYSLKLKKQFNDLNIRVTLDEREEKLSYKIRESQLKKIPYTLIIGDNEIKDNTISYRKHGESKTETINNSEFIEMINKSILTKQL